MNLRKAILLALVATGAQAATITPLATPAGVPSAYPAKAVCIATTFNADDSSNGSCYSQTASGSSGRGGHPTYTNLVYNASWDQYGNALSGTVYCGKYVVNVPSVHVWTYAPGFDATTCVLPTPAVPQILLYDPTRGFDVEFGYYSTSADGAFALITLGLEGLIYGF
jgi:hypothetical protein